MQILVKCFDLVSLCPAGAFRIIYVMYVLALLLGTLMANRGHGVPGLLHTTWMKTRSPGLCKL
jgi:hypothetical protein